MTTKIAETGALAEKVCGGRQAAQKLPTGCNSHAPPCPNLRAERDQDGFVPFHEILDRLSSVRRASKICPAIRLANTCLCIACYTARRSAADD